MTGHELTRRSGSHIWRAFGALLLVAMLILQTHGDVGAAANPLDQRIGGSVSTFEAKYGSATNDPGSDVGDVRSYANKNYKNLSVQAMDGYVYRVAFDLPDTAAWTTAKAGTVAKRFLPADATCDEPGKAVDQVISVVCQSTALMSIMFPADYARAQRTGEAGSLSIAMTLNSAKESRVAHIEAVIGTAEAPEASIAAEPIQAPSTDSDVSASGYAYLLSIGNDITLLGSSSETLDTLLTDVSPYDLLDPNWLSSFAVVLGTWQYVYSEATSRAVPAQYADLNDLWLDVTWNLNEAATWYAYAVDNLDADAFELGTSYLSAATASLNLFTPEYLAALNAATGGTSI
ncbi:MAG TPA: hypothetical protein PK691_10220 [Thermomicrobiales bacterium]|nr:hypothetical protein [Thermomicrobiales bacterium]